MTRSLTMSSRTYIANVYSEGPTKGQTYHLTIRSIHILSSHLLLVSSTQEAISLFEPTNNSVSEFKSQCFCCVLTSTAILRGRFYTYGL